MISGTGALVVLVALTGCWAGSYELDDDSLGTPNIRPKVFGSSLQKATSRDSLNYLNPDQQIQPKVAGPPCSINGAPRMVPAGSSVTFTSPRLPAKALRATNNQCGWQFTTVPGSTFTLRCPSSSMSGQDFLYVYEYGSVRPLVKRFRLQSFPSRMLLNSRKVRVLFQNDQSENESSFSCTITASGSTPAKPASISSADSSSKSCKCGIVNRKTRIVGGTDTQVNEYPWQVGFMNTSEYAPDRNVFCGGSLINDRYIVTAAHCMPNLTTSSFRLLLGGHTKDSPSAKEKIVNPIRIINHPQYNVGTDKNNDISIIEIAPLDLNDPDLVARPVCLPNSAKDYVGVMATITGWGNLKTNGTQPDILKQVKVPIVTNTFCESVYGPNGITDNMICAGTNVGGTDSCQGDSGGPLIAPDGANYELIGVVSFGRGCGLPGVPGVYVRVTALLPWIESIVAGSTSCVR